MFINNNQKKYVEIVVNFFNNLKGYMSIDELNMLFECVNNNMDIKLNDKDCEICNEFIEMDDFIPICHYFENIIKKKQFDYDSQKINI